MADNYCIGDRIVCWETKRNSWEKRREKKKEDEHGEEVRSGSLGIL